MIRLIVLLRVKDRADTQTVRDLLAQAAASSRQEQGCQRFEAYQSQADLQRFILVEWWESQSALDAHRKAHAYTQIYQPKVLPLVDREPHPSSLLE